MMLAVLPQVPPHSPPQSGSVTLVSCGVWQGHEKAVRDVDLPVDFHSCNLFASCSLDKTVHIHTNQYLLFLFTCASCSFDKTVQPHEPCTPFDA